MKLNQKQKAHLLGLISEGLQSDEINKRAAEFDQAYSVSRQQVDYYRDSREVRLREIEESIEGGALKSGFARKEARVAALDELASAILDELRGGRRWLPQVKALGTGQWMQVVDYEEFNAPGINTFRALLDDIAKEVGDRGDKLEVTGKDGAALPPVHITIEQPAKIEGA